MAIWRNAGEPAPLPFLGENTEPLKLQISMLTVPISILVKEYSFKRSLGGRRKDKSGASAQLAHFFSSIFPLYLTLRGIQLPSAWQVETTRS